MKITLGMDILRCESPEMVRKEIWMHLLGYNVIRTLMAQAAVTAEVLPREISFTGARQTYLEMAQVILLAEGTKLTRAYQALLQAIAGHRVGDRPDRYEPRARKRRPRHYPFLNEPREQARERLAATT